MTYNLVQIVDAGKTVTISFMLFDTFLVFGCCYFATVIFQQLVTNIVLLRNNRREYKRLKRELRNG